MKHIYIFALFYALSMNLYAKTITLNIPDEEIKIVENDVMDAEQWIKDAWAGKVSNSKERLIRSEVDESVKKGEAIPAGEAAIVTKAFTRPGYKNRKDREIEKRKEVDPIPAEVPAIP